MVSSNTSGVDCISNLSDRSPDSDSVNHYLIISCYHSSTHLVLVDSHYYYSSTHLVLFDSHYLLLINSFCII